METYEDYIWTTRDGTEIKVDDMTTSHIINSIKMLKRALDHWSKEEAAGWSFLSGVQGEMAQYYIEKDLDELGRIQCAISGWIDIFKGYLRLRANNIKAEDSRWSQ